jgi:hypothetical protein
MAMTDATQSAPGTDPDRASFTTALQTATGQLATAQNITGRPSAITTAILATLLPPRRPRYSARTVKYRSRYPARAGDPRPALPATITAVTITIHPPPPGGPPPRRRQPPRNSHRHQVITLMTTTPGQPWTGRDLAAKLGLPHYDLLRRLSKWARAGHLTRTSWGTYAPAKPP